MAYDLYLEERINRLLRERAIEFESKKMMGGLCYLVNDKMCVGIVQDKLMCRIGKEEYDIALQKAHVGEMTFTGRAMKGYVFVEADGHDLEEDLLYWIQKCIDFNPLAKQSRKRRKNN